MTRDDASFDRSAAEVLQRRAERLRAAPAREEDEEWVWLAELRLQDEYFVLPLSSLRGAIPLRGVAPVPLAPPHVVGLVRYDAQLITVYSLAALLGVRGWQRDPNVLLVLEPAPGKLCAVDSESIPEAVAVGALVVARATSQAEAPGRTSLHVPGQRLRVLLDLSELVGSANASRGRAALDSGAPPRTSAWIR